jgi:hypothetical protein
LRAARCGFDDSPSASGSDMLMLMGPSLQVDIGFDTNFPNSKKSRPEAGITGVWALVDSGATESCIDNLLATQLKLPIIDRRSISGAGGQHQVNIYQAQVHVPSVGINILGSFAGVKLSDGGQEHRALLGRTFLRHFIITYEGHTGTVTLTPAR